MEKGEGMGQCYYFSVDVKHAIHLYVRSEVLEMDAVSLPLLAYCNHVPATRLMYSLVSFLLSHSTATFSRDIKPWLVARIQTPLLMSQTSASPTCAHSLQLQPVMEGKLMN